MLDMGLQSPVKEANLNLPSSMLLAFLSGYLCSERQWLVVDASGGRFFRGFCSGHRLSSILMVTAAATAAAVVITAQMGEHSRHPIPSTTAAAV
jgi:hypothetical protein